MRKIIVTLTLLSISIIIAMAQETNTNIDTPFKMTMGQEYKNDNALTDNILNDAKGNIFIIRHKNHLFSTKKTIIEKYSPDLKQIFQKDLIIKTDLDVKKFELIDIYQAKDNIYAIASYFNLAKGKRTYYSLRLNENGELTELKPFYDYDCKQKNVSINLLHSENKAYFCLQEISSEKIAFSVFDVNFDMKWHKENKSPMIMMIPDLAEMMNTALSHSNWGIRGIDDNGRTYGYKDSEENTAGNFGKNIPVGIITITELDGETTMTIPFDLKGNRLLSFELLPDGSGEFVAAGTFADTRKKSTLFRYVAYNTYGCFRFKINATQKKIEAQKIINFSQKIFNFFKIKPKDAADGEGIKDIHLKKVWETEKYAYFNLEQGNSGINYNTKLDNDVLILSDCDNETMASIIIKTDKSGTVLNEIIIPKAIRSKDKYQLYEFPNARPLGKNVSGLSTITTNIGDHVFVLYNDHHKNFDEILPTYKDVHTAESPLSGNLLSFKSNDVDAVCSTIDEDGTYSKSKILKNETEYMILDSGNFCDYGENALILDAYLYNTHKLIKIEF